MNGARDCAPSTRLSQSGRPANNSLPINAPWASVEKESDP